MGKYQESLEILGAVTKELKKVHSKEIQWLTARRPKSLIQKPLLTQSLKDRLTYLPIEIMKDLVKIRSLDVITVDYTSIGRKRLSETVGICLDKNGVVCMFAQSRMSSVLKDIESGFSYLAIVHQKPVLPVAVYMNNEKLYISFGEKQTPPEHLRSKEIFCEKVTFIIASRLPEQYRGKYKKINL